MFTEFASDDVNVKNDIPIEMLDKSEGKDSNPLITPPPQVPLKMPPPLERRLTTRRKHSTLTSSRPLEVRSPPARLFNEHFTPTLPQPVKDKNLWVDCLMFTDKDDVKTDPDNTYEVPLLDDPQQKSQKLLSTINNVVLEDSKALINGVEEQMGTKNIKPMMDLLFTESSLSTQILTQGANKTNAIENSDQTLVPMLLPQQLLDCDNGGCYNMNEGMSLQYFIWQPIFIVNIILSFLV